MASTIPTRLTESHSESFVFVGINSTHGQPEFPHAATVGTA